uniref:Fibronectin type-III domain-containing protein n=1 Tax=Setaria digitata TaxID=48799 RepID=A0A915PRW3_9BILA
MRITFRIRILPAKFFTEFINRTYAEVLKYKVITSRKLKSRFEVPIDKIIVAGGEDEVAEFLWAHLENAHFVEVPFIAIYILLFVYVIAASYLISWIEGWSIYDGFYFVIISMLTIGFGDLVPRNQPFILLTLLTILFGLILATTFIDVVGTYYIDRLHFFGRNLDLEDSLEWLKKVQQRRLIAMKREAMRKLFETVAALQHMHIDAPNPPRNLRVTDSTADSIALTWDPPLHDNGGRGFWYTIAYRIRTPRSRNNPATVIEFITSEQYVVTGLRSFTLYRFSVATTTRFGSSKPITCHEYTEPCTVPQSLSLVALSCETATFVWDAPHKNIAPESYTVLLSQEPAPQFHSWRSYSCGNSRRFTVTELLPNTR